MLVDLALESRPGMPATASVAGPTFAPEELAWPQADRAVRSSRRPRLRRCVLLGPALREASVARTATLIDLGFDTQVLAAMIEHLDAYTDVDLLLDAQVTDIPALRAFFADWAAELRGG
ncbi:MAG: hypothetical protein L0H79_08565 [Intrasporangium sp.]|uniref:hypothetical protein n=1 Tax=Intrasporangium sp. TaxID=1925024 RepID=UPI0026486F34|nr:hypothetical protein [Intrasporangium sp.]MDN5795788.1 hypothetical protein [Intrasporangium sp.]